jgi:hypothetical protein
MTSRTRLAQILGVSVRRVEQLAVDGLLVRDGGGFHLEKSCERYIQHLRRDDATREARRALLRQQTRRHELLVAREAHVLIRHDEALAAVTDWWARLWTAIDASLATAWHELGLVAVPENQRRLVLYRIRDRLRGEMLLGRGAAIPELFADVSMPEQAHFDTWLQRLGIGTSPPGNGHDIEDLHGD